jgi:hypothetical protein
LALCEAGIHFGSASAIRDSRSFIVSCCADGCGCRRPGEGGMSVSILTVDDEADITDLFRQHFRREVREGVYVLHFACSADEALAKLADGIRPQTDPL